MNHAQWLRDEAELCRTQWEGFDESIVGDDAERLEAAADYIEHLEAQVRERGCRECADLGHHPRCDGYIPSIGELLGDY